jgi:hypothetical protein
MKKGPRRTVWGPGVGCLPGVYPDGRQWCILLLALVRTPKTSGRSSKGKVSPAERAIGLPDLIRSGRLLPGGIHAHYDGQDWPATLTEQGQIVIDGRSHSSPSAAGETVKIASRGPELPKSVLATDGWLFWRAQDQIVGDVVTLKELRRRQAAQP